MARYKVLDMSSRVLPADLEVQRVPRTLARAMYDSPVRARRFRTFSAPVKGPGATLASSPI